MAWTATVGDSYQSGNRVSTLVVLDDGAGNVFRERFINDGTPRSLKNAVLAWLAARDPVTNVLKCVPSGTTVTLDPEPDASPQPTAEQIARRDFAVAWRRHRQAQLAVANGLVAANNAQVLAAEADMKAKWQPAFVDLLVTV